MINGEKYHRFNNPTLTQGGWQRTGEGNNYIRRETPTDPEQGNYDIRVATIEYVPDVTTNKIKIFAYENIGFPMEVSVLALRNDNYILESLSWKENGGVFTISANYDKLGVMFRYQNNAAITPDNITGIRITNWFDTPIPTRKLHNKTDIITSLPVDIYTDGQPIGENLFDYKTAYTSYLQPDGTIIGTAPQLASISNSLANFVGQTVTISIYCSNVSATRLQLTAKENGVTKLSNSVYRGNSGYLTLTITPALSTDYWAITYGDTGTNEMLSQFMLNTGSTALPYQPYAPTIIKGNMSQSGTPTPTSPITPQECGERSENLIDYTISEAGSIASDGEEIVNPYSWRGTNYIELKDNTSYVMKKTMHTLRICYYDSSKTFISREGVTSDSSKVLTIPNNAKYIRWCIYADGIQASLELVNSMQIMVVEGTTAPSAYIPYGYVLPIKSGSTTTPVYLGEVQSMRKIKQIILKGGEISTVDTSVGQALLSISDKCLGVAPISSHYKGKVVTAWSQLSDGECGLLNNGTVIRICDTTNVTSAPAYNQYLATQYAAGTPVCVWYVLATETTTALNEPLRKIGDYADSVSVTGIPTTVGGIEFDVDTSLKPSEVDLTYHGWHDISPKQSSRTINLFDDHNIITIAGLGDRYGVVLPEGTYSIYNGTEKTVYSAIDDFINRQVACEAHSTATVTLTTLSGTTCGFFMGLNAASQNGCTIVSGSTPPDHYIPYIEWS